MKAYFKIIILFLYAAFITIIISPVLAGIIPFHLYKVISRTMVITTFLLMIYYKDKFGFSDLKGLGFEFGKKWWFLFASGIGLGIISLGIISWIMISNSVRFVVPELKLINWGNYLLIYLCSGLFVAFFEEFIFRGFILQALLKDSTVFFSLFFANIIYSIVHFLKPPVLEKINVLSLMSSINAIPAFFTPLIENFYGLFPSIIGLFLIGIVLSSAYIRFRSLAMPIGLHASWVLGVKLLSKATDVTVSGSFWMTGDVTGSPITWFVLIVFILILAMLKNGIFKPFRQI